MLLLEVCLLLKRKNFVLLKQQIRILQPSNSPSPSMKMVHQLHSSPSGQWQLCVAVFARFGLFQCCCSQSMQIKDQCLATASYFYIFNRVVACPQLLLNEGE